ncbi:MAG: hypothetical protein ACSNEK_10395 [Parachlamydiaceae bacterium]
MNPRDTLLEMRQQRELELTEYQSILSKIEHPFLHHLENVASKRRAVLTLELPFKSDSVSLNQALVKESFDNEDTSEKSLEAWAQSDYNTFEGKYIKYSFKQFLQTKWPYTAPR